MKVSKQIEKSPFKQKPTLKNGACNLLKNNGNRESNNKPEKSLVKASILVDLVNDQDKENSQELEENPRKPKRKREEGNIFSKRGKTDLLVSY